MAGDLGSLTRVNVVVNPKYQKSGLKSYVHLLRKYNFAPSLDGPYFVSNKVQPKGKFGGRLGGKARVTERVLQKRVYAAGGSGEVTAEDSQNDSQYLCPVSIGTPGQTLNLDFDTGSADLWVWSTKLSQEVQSKGRSAGHHIFDASESKTFHTSDQRSWQIQYGDSSSASGTVGTDHVTIGGLTLECQAVELADKLSEQFISGEGDGLLGLAWGNINTVKPVAVATPVENMISQADIPKSAELFTAYLGSYKDANEPDKGESFYTFGFIDQDVLKSAGVVESAIPYVAVDNSQGFWQFQSTSAMVNGKIIKRSRNTAIADTGTTLALVDDKTCKAIYKAIPGSKYDSTQQGYVFPTSTTVDKLPTVSFAVGGTQFQVQKEDLGFADAGNGMTYGGIQSRGDMTFDILGDTFLKSVYAIFDQGNKRFGAVQRVEQGQSVGTSAAQASYDAKAEKLQTKQTTARRGTVTRLRGMCCMR